MMNLAKLEAIKVDSTWDSKKLPLRLFSAFSNNSYKYYQFSMECLGLN